MSINCASLILRHKDRGQTAMKKYIVTIEEILSKELEIFANSKEDAEDIVMEGYDNSEYVLCADDHTDTTFSTRRAVS